MQKTTLLLLFILFSISVSSQKKATNYCELWKSKKEKLSNYDSIISLNKIYIDSVSVNCRVEIYNSIAYNLRDKRQLDSSLYYFDKAEKLTIELKDNAATSSIYFQKANIYVNRNFLDSALVYLTKSKELLKNNTNDDFLMQYYDAMSTYMHKKIEIEKGFKYADSAIQAAIRLKDTVNLPNLYQNKGVKYFNNERHNEAFESLLKALELKEKYNHLDIAGTYYLLGNMYNVINNYDISKKYLEKSIAASKSAKNSYVTMLSYSAMVRQKSALKDFEAALKYLDSGKVIAKLYKNLEALADFNNQEARVYIHHLKDYEKAKVSLKGVYHIAKNAGDNFLLHSTLYSLYDVNFKSGNYPRSKFYLDEMTKLAEKTKDISNKREIAREKGRYYKKIGNHKKALENYIISFKIYDSLEKANNRTQLADLEKKYDTQKKELQIVKLNQEKKEQELLTKEATLKQQLFLVIAIISLLTLVAGFWLYNKIRKQKNELSKAHKEVSEINNVKNRLFSIIAHDLRGMIIPFKRAGKVLNYNIDKERFDKVKTLSNELENNSQKLSNVLDNLLNWSLEQMNGYILRPEELSIKEELGEITENFKQHANEKNTSIELLCKEDYVMHIDKGAFHIIFRNLLSNAIKYTDKGKITITFEKEKEKIRYKVSDTGVGMTDEQKQNLFTLNKNESTIGTEGEKGTGLGLNLVYRFVTMLKGEISVSSKLEKGTSFDIVLPQTQTIITNKTTV